MIQTRLLVTDPSSALKVFRAVELSGLDWLALGEQAAALVARETASRDEYFRLGGMDGPSPYDTTVHALETLMTALQTARQDLLALAQHGHEWSEDHYCLICGADGAA